MQLSTALLSIISQRLLNFTLLQLDNYSDRTDLRTSAKSIIYTKHPSLAIFLAYFALFMKYLYTTILFNLHTWYCMAVLVRMCYRHWIFKLDTGWNVFFCAYRTFWLNSHCNKYLKWIIFNSKNLTCVLKTFIIYIAASIHIHRKK